MRGGSKAPGNNEPIIKFITEYPVSKKIMDSSDLVGFFEIYS